MRNALIGTFIAILALALLQPLLETFNVLTEKVTFGAAILNSCRAARSNALMDDDMRDLNADIDEATFKEYFSKAFCDTLDLSLITPPGAPGNMEFRSSSGRWNDITVSLTLDTPDDLYFHEREVITATVELSTPYVFRLSLLQEMAGRFPPDNFVITETRHFEMQIIN